ncbi:MAG: hypothetical protein R3A79_26490 [Nannocystaceae bacterium]
MKTAQLLSSLVVTSALACSGSSGEETASTTNASSTATASTGTTDSGGTDTGGLDRAVCDRYIACVGATTPEALPAAMDGFGPDATCWTQSQSEIDICLSACETGMETAHTVYPDVVECYLCTEDSECDEAAGEKCFLGSCSVGMCGDGLVQSDELCDGQDGCWGDCLGGAECSPLTGVGCDEGELCTMGWSTDIRVICKGLDEVFDCDGVICETGEYCRTEGESFLGCYPLCDLNAPQPCPDGLECVQVELGGFSFPDGHALSYLGRCQ